MTDQLPDVAQRFLRYVQVDSPGDPDAPEDLVPSLPQQHDMARLLAEELAALGCDNVATDEHAYVTAAVPASPGAEAAEPLALIAHIDVSHDVPNTGVKPQVTLYEGGALGMGDLTVLPDEVPTLAAYAGGLVITSDGTTLLSADDKAGVAEIMALVARIAENPELPHPPLRIAFVPDEEIGHGASLLDLDAFGAAYAYTVDGGPVGEISYECFNAVGADVTITGSVVHPGDAKHRMVNALTLWRQLDAMLPQDERPENTEGYEGYFHCTNLTGDCGEVRAHYILRDFDAAGMAHRRVLLETAAGYLNEKYGTGRVSVAFHEEYCNMAEHLTDVPFLVDNALAATRACGVEPQVRAIRGGTDGAQLTFRGLPCPNLGTGGALCHSLREFVPVRALEAVTDILQDLVARFV